MDEKPRKRKTNVPNQSNKAIKEPSTKDVKGSKVQQTHKDLEHATNPTTHRLWLRSVVIFSVMTLVYFYTKNHSKETKFALVKENLPLRMQKFPCSLSYEQSIKHYPKCVPRKCGRFVTDSLIDVKEADILLQLAESIIPKAGSNGKLAFPHAEAHLILSLLKF